MLLQLSFSFNLSQFHYVHECVKKKKIGNLLSTLKNKFSIFSVRTAQIIKKKQ